MATLVLEDLLASDDYDKWIKEVKDKTGMWTELDRLFPYTSSKLNQDDLHRIYEKFDANSDGEVTSAEIYKLYS